MTLNSPKTLGRIAGLVLLVAALWIAPPFVLPSRGLDRAWDRLLEAMEERDADTLHALIAADYRDGFGQDRDEAIALFDQAAGQFISLNIRRLRPVVHVESSRLGTTEAVVRVGGHGTPLAQMVVQGSAAIDAPTTFRWRRTGWQPWRWQLTFMDNPAVRNDVRQFRARLERLGRETGGVLLQTR
ncbi:MAG: hypothetical protein ABII82_19345 [Verrucomicrobiota bacterium]